MADGHQRTSSKKRVFFSYCRTAILIFVLLMPGPLRAVSIELPDGSAMDFVWIPVTESGNKKEIKIGDFSDPQGKEPVRKEIIWGPFEKPGSGWGYYLGKTEVTMRQWNAVMGGDDDTDLPVTGRSFNEIQDFLEKLDAAAKNGSVKGLPQKSDGSSGLFKLPSEAEWEYAARGAIGQEYEAKHPYGSEREIERYEVISSAGSGGEIRPSASLPANAVGLHDMFGNVREYVADSSTGAGRILKGGGFLSESREIRSSARTEQPSSAGRPDAGFRLCISAEENTKLGQTPIGTDYLPAEEDPQVAQAVALIAAAVKARSAIARDNYQISVVETAMPAASGSQTQATLAARIQKLRTKIAENEGSLGESLAELSLLPQTAKDQAFEIAREKSEERDHEILSDLVQQFSTSE